MKITGQQPGSVADARASREAGGASRARAPQAAPASGRGDRVELSPLARALQSLRAEVGDPEAVDADRVAQLRAAVSNGSYDAPAQDVANALLRELAANRIA